jgi:hypothetical protein
MAATVPFTLGNASAGLIEICWNPDHDSAVLVPFGELYALTHTIQSNDAFHRQDKQLNDWPESGES